MSNYALFPLARGPREGSRQRLTPRIVPTAERFDGSQWSGAKMVMKTEMVAPKIEGFFSVT